MLSRIDKFGLTLVPGVMFLGGSFNLYAAYCILGNYTQDKELVGILEGEGISWEEKSAAQKADILEQVKAVIKKEDPEQLVAFINSLK